MFGPLTGLTLLGAGAAFAYKVRERPMDKAENRRRVWKTLPGVDVPPGVQTIRDEFVTSKGIKLFTVEYIPEGKSKGVLCVCHGYADQIDWVWYARCMRLVKEGYTIIGLDLEGHGRSDGTLVYIPSFLRLVEGAFEVFKSKRDKYKGQKCFLAGESMGGAVALWMLLHFGQEHWDGLWLMCPMCKISDDLTPPKVVVQVLTALSAKYPEWPIVPSERIVDKAYRNPKWAQAVKESPYYVDFDPRLRTAVQLLEATAFIEKNMEKITLPYLLVQGDADTVTDPKTCEEFVRRSQSKDKTFKLYPGVWHGIYEDPDGEKAWKDTFEWLDKHL